MLKPYPSLRWASPVSACVVVALVLGCVRADPEPSPAAPPAAVLAADETVSAPPPPAPEEPAAVTPPDAPLAAPIVIDLYHDTVCPWCRIGHERLARALARFDGPPVVVRYHPFELDPDLPPEGAELRARLAAKYGAAQVDGMFARVTDIGAADGLAFHFDRIERTPNTLASHVLVEAAPDERRGAVLGAIHVAYFEHGRDIGDAGLLADLFASVGLPREDAVAALGDRALRDEVRRRATDAPRLGIRGVPYFVLHRDPSSAPGTAPAGAVRLSGAQPVDALLAALQQAATGP